MKIREFYYKLICYRLATGEWLYRVGMTNSNVCTFCNYNASSKPENLTTENIMLGISISELPVEENLCLLYAKYFIYGVNIENKN